MQPAHRRLTAWIALVAMLALALVPTVSRALAFAQGGAGVEVCTPRGVQRIASERPDGAPSRLHATLEHCPLCPLASGDAAWIAPVRCDVPAAASDVPSWPASTPAARHRAPWLQAPSRAPPSST